MRFFTVGRIGGFAPGGILVKLGGVICVRCGEEIKPYEPWDLDHDPDGGPRAYLGPSHARCNRATNGSARRVSRIW